MAEPTIVPPTPTITQPSAPGVDNSPGMEAVQRAFDRVLPPKGPVKPAAETPSPAPAPPEPTPPPIPQEPAPPTPPKPTSAKPDEVDVPSFLEQALRSDTPPATPTAPAEDEWPEELPTFKTSEEAKERYKKWRESYGTLKKELTTLREKPALTHEQQERMQVLEGQNKQYQEVLTRLGVEQSAEFQQTIIRPLYAAWGEAARIVKDSGGDPQELAKAMALNGKAQFEALDDLFREMPESAKAEAHDALRVYRRYEEARRQAVANAPQAMEGIRRREVERQLQEVNKQREDMKGIFENAVKHLRDNKLEVLLKTDIPDAQWWNEQGDRIIAQARDLYLENADITKVAMACVLAPTAEVYRKLWVNSQKKIGQLQKIINERIGNEPNLSESSGSQAIPTSGQQLQDDLKKPFTDVFLREFHKSQARSR